MQYNVAEISKKKKQSKFNEKYNIILIPYMKLNIIHFFYLC